MFFGDDEEESTPQPPHLQGELELFRSRGGMQLRGCMDRGCEGEKCVVWCGLGVQLVAGRTRQNKQALVLIMVSL